MLGKLPTMSRASVLNFQSRYTPCGPSSHSYAKLKKGRLFFGKNVRGDEPVGNEIGRTRDWRVEQPCFIAELPLLPFAD